VFEVRNLLEVHNLVKVEHRWVIHNLEEPNTVLQLEGLRNFVSLE
jgi:hypothetical protein